MGVHDNSKKIKVKLPDGAVIERVPKIVPFGNFQQIIIRYENEDYLVGDGDEYLRGDKEMYELGKKFTNAKRENITINTTGKAWDRLPFFRDEINKDNVWLYDSVGVARELTDKHRKKIEEIESTNSNLKVIAVLEGTYELGEADKATMTSYVYLDGGYEPWVIVSGIIGFFADVVNESWDIEEEGSIGITERAGLVKRVM